MTDAAPAPRYQVGYASGVFDMFHVGHLRILQHSRLHCATLVVGVATDEYVESLKGTGPVIPFEERLEIVASLRLVDEVVADTSEDKKQAWERRPFDAIFKGDDWRGDPRGTRLEADMADLGVEVVYFPYTRQTSSSMLRARLQRHNWL
jgi:glycerol-3-phosphate cytidylyltransferase